MSSIVAAIACCPFLQKCVRMREQCRVTQTSAFQLQPAHQIVPTHLSRHCLVVAPDAIAQADLGCSSGTRRLRLAQMVSCKKNTSKHPAIHQEMDGDTRSTTSLNQLKMLHSFAHSRIIFAASKFRRFSRIT
jgi:hypothetical protein